MASFIRIPGVNPDPSRPVALSVDPVKASAGALMLVDFTDPLSDARVGGVPVHGGTVPNNAWQSAAALTGGTSAQLAAVIDAGGMSGSKGKVERTGKSGLHVLFSQKNNLDAADRTHYSLMLPVLLRDYLTNNPGNKLFLSIWGHTTRPASAHSNSNVSIGGIDQGSVGYRLQIDSNRASWPLPETTPYHLGQRGTGRAPVGALYRNIAASGTVGSLNLNASVTERARLFAVGNTGSINTYTGGGTPPPQGNSGSHILYRAYLEDLTVSGRTYAQVDALDYAYYTQECLTPGGRFYSDTFTDPSVLP